MCPAIADGNTLKCGMSGFVLDHQPSYAIAMELRELEAEKGDPFFFSEGDYEDSRKDDLKDPVLERMLTAETSEKTFEDVNSNLFAPLREFCGDILNRESR